MGHAKPVLYRLAAKRVCDFHGGVVHVTHNAKFLRKRQAKGLLSRKTVISQTLQAVDRPFEDIAEKLKWHRTLTGLSQEDYAKKIGVKRSRYSRWEAGNDRLSLDGALMLRRKYGLSLDFMYEGIDDALPMTLRNAWNDRP